MEKDEKNTRERGREGVSLTAAYTSRESLG